MKPIAPSAATPAPSLTASLATSSASQQRTRLPEKFDRENPATKDPREYERRLLLGTFRTFDCEDGQPTLRYTLLGGAKKGFLNP